MDFLTWYQDSETRGMVRWLKVIRKYFPNEPIDIPLGNGEDVQTDGVDRTAVAVAAAAFAPIGIRSTHAGFNRNLYPQAYWFYKRMAPMAHSSGESFGTEPPGGDFTYSETQRAVFEAACAGANLIYQYYQNYHKTPAPGMTPHIIDDYKAALRPYELPLVDIGILFPTSQMMLDLGAHPDGQLQFCASGRSYFDYDLVDENMIEWNQLNRYKVLLQTSGTIFRDSTFPAVNTWLTKGGFLVTKGLPRWHDLDGNEKQSLVWLRHEDTAASDNLARTGASGVHVFHVGKGTIYAIDAPDMPAYLSAVVPVLSSLSSVTPLHGFKPVDDGTWMTEFPDGKLVCDSKTYATKFVPAR